MNEPTFYIHAGLHKTGTTSIQYFLDKNKSNLKKNNIIYLEIGKHGHAQHLIPWAIKDSHRIDDKKENAHIINKLKKTINNINTHHLLISSEEFEFFNEKNVLQLKKITGAINCKIIFYIKRQDNLLISEYKQLVKQYRTRFSGSLLDFIFSYKFWSRLNYFSLLEKWSKHFGPDALEVKIFDPQKFTNTNVIHDFLHILNLNADDFASQDWAHQNRSPSDLACEVIRSYNDLPINQKTHERIVELSQELSTLADHGDDFSLISEKERRSICSAFELSNNQIVEKYFKKHQNKPEQLFSNDFKTSRDDVKKHDIVLAIKERINNELNLQHP